VLDRTRLKARCDIRTDHLTLTLTLTRSNRRRRRRCGNLGSLLPCIVATVSTITS